MDYHVQKKKHPYDCNGVMWEFLYLLHQWLMSNQVSGAQGTWPG